MPRPYRLGLVGLGKIAATQHLPAIARSDAFELVAVADPNPVQVDVPRFASIEAMIASGPPLDAVSICTPPRGRRAIAAAALDAGLAVMLEKPPAATVGEVALLDRQAQAAGLTLFGSWHSREATAVAAAAAWLAGRAVRRVRIDWREDIRRWHPGQEWILDASGFGVFDPAINALSILTATLPGTIAARQAVLHVPANRQAPIAAEAELVLDGDLPISLALDFLQAGPQVWDITVDTDSATLRLGDGGARLFIDAVETPLPAKEEYDGLYARFAALIAAGGREIDAAPLRIVEDILAVARRVETDEFRF